MMARDGYHRSRDRRQNLFSFAFLTELGSATRSKLRTGCTLASQLRDTCFAIEICISYAHLVLVPVQDCVECENSELRAAVNSRSPPTHGPMRGVQLCHVPRRNGSPRWAQGRAERNATQDDY